jgi:flagellar motor switch protein FliG
MPNPFTDAEKEACIPYIDMVVECANMARKEGVLALEKFVPTLGNDFLTYMMMLVCDGTDPKLVIGIGETLIQADDHTGKDLLERRILLEGVLSVQAGENPRIIETKLYSMLGEKFLKAHGLFPVYDREKHVESQQAKLAEVNKYIKEIPESADFNQLFLSLSNRDVQMLLRETDCRDLSLALKGCSPETASHILSNMSLRLGCMIIENIEYMGTVSKENVLKAQEQILAILKRLQKAGEIVLVRHEQ